MRRSRLRFSPTLLLLAAACAAPQVAPVAVDPISPGRGERVVVDHSILLVDSSGSIARRDFPAQRARLESLVASMPAGGYEAGSIGFGGVRREVYDLAAFDRDGLASFSQGLSYLSEGTPIHSALADAGAALEGRSGRAAITLISDGLVTDAFGVDVPQERALDAARAAADGYGGSLCIHTVQVGNDPAGTAFLDRLAHVTGCGSQRNASSLETASGLQAFQREVYLDAAPARPAPAPRPIAAKTPGDADRDGVRDDRDTCPGTPGGARVDGRGCWVIEGLNFATNSAEIEAASRARLEREVVPVIQRARGIRLRIDGHTDSRGAEAYNQQLSERRARAVRDFLVSKGVPSRRLQYRGFGESRPMVPNDTAANLRKNRRTELTVVGQN